MLISHTRKFKLSSLLYRRTKSCLDWMKFLIFEILTLPLYHLGAGEFKPIRAPFWFTYTKIKDCYFNTLSDCIVLMAFWGWGKCTRKMVRFLLENRVNTVAPLQPSTQYFLWCCTYLLFELVTDSLYYRVYAHMHYSKSLFEI